MAKRWVGGDLMEEGLYLFLSWEKRK